MAYENDAAWAMKTAHRKETLKTRCRLTWVLSHPQGFQQKFAFHSKEIVAISCSWCKQAVSARFCSGSKFTEKGQRAKPIVPARRRDRAGAGWRSQLTSCLCFSITTRWPASCCSRSRSAALWALTPQSSSRPPGSSGSAGHRYKHTQTHARAHTHTLMSLSCLQSSLKSSKKKKRTSLKSNKASKKGGEVRKWRHRCFDPDSWLV